MLHYVEVKAADEADGNCVTQLGAERRRATPSGPDERADRATGALRTGYGRVGAGRVRRPKNGSVA